MTDIFELLKGKQNSNSDLQKQPVIVQGITGKFGTQHTKLMIEYGTNIVAGVTPGKDGKDLQKHLQENQFLFMGRSRRQLTKQVQKFLSCLFRLNSF